MIETQRCDGGTVRKLHFYSAQGVWLTIDNGQLIHTGQNGQRYNVLEVHTDEPKRAIKLNVGRGDNFWMKHIPKHAMDHGCELYIHCPQVVSVEVLVGESETQKHYAQQFEIPIGIKLDNNELIPRLRYVGGQHRWEDTPFGQEVRRVKTMLELDGVSSDGVAELLKLYDVRRKVPCEYVVTDDAEYTVLLAPHLVERLVEKRIVYRVSHASSPERNVFQVHRDFRRDNPETWQRKLQHVACSD